MDKDLPYQIGFCLIALVTVGPVFFYPIIVARRRGNHVWLVAFCNIFLGWTVIGWGLAMVLASGNEW